MMRRSGRGMNSNRKRPIRPSYKFESAMRGRNRRTSMYSRLRESVQDSDINFYLNGKCLFTGSIYSGDFDRILWRTVPRYRDLFVNYLLDYLYDIDFDTYGDDEVADTFAELVTAFYEDRTNDTEFYVQQSLGGNMFEIFIV